MTVKEMAAFVGKEAIFRVTPNLTIRVVITDVRKRFGSVDFEVSPIGGEGKQWVDSDGNYYGPIVIL